MKAKPPSLSSRDDKAEIGPEAVEGVYSAAFAYYARLERVRTYIEQNLSDRISLKTAARIAGLEEKYFSAFFRAKTGICFKQWLTRLRVSYAAEMMASRDHSITNVALAAGFQDLRTFERAFKQHFGMTPRAYKHRVRPR